MTEMRTGGGFLGGAAVGLALALLVVAAGSVLLKQGGPSQASAPVEYSGGVSFAASTSSQASTSRAVPSLQGAGPAGVSAPQAQVAGEANSSSTSAVNAAGSPTSTVRSPAQPRPSSTLSMLPAEGAAAVATATAPVLVGLLAALVVYAAYSRREDASS